MPYLKQSEAKVLIRQAFDNAGRKSADFQMKINGGTCQVVVQRGPHKGVIASGVGWFNTVNALVNGLKIIQTHKAKKLILKVGPTTGKTISLHAHQNPEVV